MKKTVFLTGTTGLIGSYLLKVLLEKGYKVFALSRDKENESAQDRVLDLLKFWDEDILLKKLGSLTILEGDVTEINLGLSENSLNLLTRELDEIFHSAAVTRFNWPLEKIRNVNVEGTKKVLDLALKFKVNGKLQKVNHISTAYVCGDYSGTFCENDLDFGQKFSTTYEQSKFEAEKLMVQYRREGLWIDIFRPPLVVGEYATGKTVTFKQGFYQLLHMLSLGVFDYLPGKGFTQNIEFVNELCRAIYKISSQTTIRNRNYHPFRCEAVPFETVLDISSEFLGFNKPELVSQNSYLENDPIPSQKMLLKSNMLHFNDKLILDSGETVNLLKELGFEFSGLTEDCFIDLLNYCLTANFLKKNYSQSLYN